MRFPVLQICLKYSCVLDYYAIELFFTVLFPSHFQRVTRKSTHNLGKFELCGGTVSIANILGAINSQVRRSRRLESKIEPYEPCSERIKK